MTQPPSPSAVALDLIEEFVDRIGALPRWDKEGRRKAISDFGCAIDTYAAQAVAAAGCPCGRARGTGCDRVEGCVLLGADWPPWRAERTKPAASDPWHAVSDVLPEPGERVLIWRPNNERLPVVEAARLLRHEGALSDWWWETPPPMASGRGSAVLPESVSMWRRIPTPESDAAALAERGRVERECAAAKARAAQLPSHFHWGNDAMEQFNFGKERAALAIEEAEGG